MVKVRFIEFFAAFCLAAFSYSARAQSDQDCEKVKKEIKELNESLSGLTDHIKALNDALAESNRQIDSIDQKIATIDKQIANIGATTFGAPATLNPFWYPIYLGAKDNIKNQWEHSKSTWLDAKAKAVAEQKQLKDAVDLDLRTIQAIKDLIADLLGKLGNCGTTDDATKQFDDCLQKQGAERDLTDPEHAHNSKTGQNFVWDKEKKSWIDTKTGECICPKCVETPTPHKTHAKPTPGQQQPTPTPTPTPSTTNKVTNVLKSVGGSVDVGIGIGGGHGGEHRHGQNPNTQQKNFGQKQKGNLKTASNPHITRCRQAIDYHTKQKQALEQKLHSAAGAADRKSLQRQIQAEDDAIKRNQADLVKLGGQ